MASEPDHRLDEIGQHMTKAGERTLKSLEEALAYARGDCKHEWSTISDSEFAVTEECQKCKVRRTVYPAKQG